MEINFHLTEDSINGLSWEEYEVFERVQDGESLKLYKLRPILARFMVDENTKPIKHADALKTLAKVKMNEIKDVVSAFMEGMQNSTVPKASGTPLNSPSEAEPTDSESLPGSE